MTHPNRIYVFLILICAGLLAACSPLSGPKALPTSTTIPLPTITLPPAVTPTSRPALSLQPCQLGGYAAQCGTLSVFENRAARSGRKIDLRVAVVKAQSPNPAPDPIFYLSGGPGSAATQDAARGWLFPFALTDSHDLVLVDQRGTGGSHRVLIPPGPDLTGLPPAEMQTQAPAWAAKVLQEMDMDPRFYTTSVAMDDLDELREVLGYQKINLFGHSYGATAAQYYLRQHEEHVRSVVLSGGSLLDVPVFELWAKNGQRALDKIFARCDADPACHAAYPDLHLEFSALLDRLNQHPAVVQFTNPSDQQPASVTFTRDLFAEIVRVMTLDANQAAHLPHLIHQAYAYEDWSGVVVFYIQYGPGDWTAQMMEHVIRCSEKWAAFAPSEVARLGAGTYLEGWYVNLANAHAFACQFTPPGETPEGQQVQPHSQVPVLLLNGEADPQNPPENVAGSQELWPNSLALIEPFQGHWLSDPSEIYCRWEILSEFIQNGSAAGLHTGCLKNIQPPAFETNK
jgi:pimeloyl-ACP methyl ester carboxylesterase